MMVDRLFLGPQIEGDRRVATPRPVRVHGPDDYVPEPGDSRAPQVRGHVQVVQEPDPPQEPGQQDGGQAGVSLLHGTPLQGPQAVQDLAPGPHQDGAAEQGHQERADLGDAHVPGQQRHVQVR